MFHVYTNKGSREPAVFHDVFELITFGFLFCQIAVVQRRIHRDYTTIRSICSRDSTRNSPDGGVHGDQAVRVLSNSLCASRVRTSYVSATEHAARMVFPISLERGFRLPRERWSYMPMRSLSADTESESVNSLKLC